MTPARREVGLPRLGSQRFPEEEVFGGMGGERLDGPGDGDGPALADMMAELADAEAAEADARAQAAAARARADVQRVLDLSTGQFHNDFSRSADDFVKTAQDSKAITKGSVNVAALEKVVGDQAVVLVAATSEVSNISGARQDPRPFRISVTVTREGEACKMSDVEFVP